MVVKLVGDCCMSDVSVALLNYKVEDRIVLLVFFSFILVVSVSCSRIPGAESAFQIGEL